MWILTFVNVCPEVLSRFDMIFLVRDVRDEDRDRLICKHVMGVHIENSESGRDIREGDIFEDSRYALIACDSISFVTRSHCC
jgi:DNA replicative helicase MCM subunit Mcm2 (Cdc46/Mcm family)